MPNRIDVTSANPKGEADERAVFGKALEADRCYLMDRGYVKFSLFSDINRIGSSYVCRVRDNSSYETDEERDLTDEDRVEGVLSDQVISLGGSPRTVKPDHPVRIIEVKSTPHTRRGKYKGGSTGIHPTAKCV